MKKMSVPFYLYRQHDMDLINIYRRDGFKFQKEVKKAIVEYANGRIYQLTIPDNLPIKSGYIAKSIPMHLTLNPNNEEELKAVNMLMNTRKGFRCQLIKAIFRISLQTLPISSFNKGSSDGFVFKRPDIDEVMQESLAEQTKTKKNSVSVDIPEQIPVPKPQSVKKDTINTNSDKAEESKAPIVDEYNAQPDDQDELAAIFGQMDSLTH